MFQRSKAVNRRSTRADSRLWQKPYEKLEHRNLLATVFGTAGADDIRVSFVDEASVSVVVNEDPVITFLIEEIDELIVDALGEEDRVRWVLFGSDTVLDDGVWQTRLGDVEIVVVNAEVITGDGSSFEFLGSEGDDTLDMGSVFSGDVSGTSSGLRFGFNNTADLKFDGRGGFDTVFFAGENGPDEFNANGAEFEFIVQDFTFVHSGQFSNFEKFRVGTGNYEGMLTRDRATIIGTEANEVLIGNTEAVSRFIGDGYEYEILDFKKVYVDGGGGEDVARLSGSTITDYFYAADDVAHVHNRYPNDAPIYSVLARNFAVTTLIAIENELPCSSLVKCSGLDQVVLVGTEGNDTFVGLPIGSSLRTENALVRASGFERVTAQGGGGMDIAYLADSEGDDTFIGGQEMSYFRGAGFFNSVSDFTHVFATSSAGGNDKAILKDSADSGDDVFYATPEFAVLRNESHRDRVTGFSYVKGISTAGQDTATFLDSSGDDVFVSTPNQSYLHNRNSYFNAAAGFSRTTAYASEGLDHAIASGSNGDDRFVSYPDMSFMRGNGFFNQGHGFDKFDAIAGLGGEDTVILFDSSGDDTLGGAMQAGWLFNPHYFNYWTGFSRVTAVGNEGGTNSNLMNPVDFALILVGNWV